MFKSNDFQEFFIPPSEYQTEEILLFTYSLNLVMLDEVLRQSKIIIHSKDRKKLNDLFDAASKRVACYVQSDRGAGVFSDERDTRYAFQFYQRGCIHKISHSKIQPKSFHPKLWALLFKNDKDEYILRLVICSRNLTKQNMLEGAIFLETDIFCETVNDKHADLLQMINDIENQTNQVNQVKLKIIDKIKRADFTDCIKSILPTGMELEEYEICTNSHMDNGNCVGLQGCFPAKYSSFTGISPFLGDGKKVSDVLQGCDNKIITRKASYTEAVYELLTSKSKTAEFYYLSNGNEAEYDENAEIQFEKYELPLHAKIYGFDNDDTNESWLFVGSANFTENGISASGNYELLLMMKIKFSTGYGGFAKLLRDDFNDVELMREQSMSNGSDFPLGKEIGDPTQEDSNQVKAAIEEGLSKIMEEHQLACDWETLNSIFRIVPKANEQPVDYAIRSIQEATENTVIEIVKRAEKAITAECSTTVNGIVKELRELGAIIN